MLVKKTISEMFSTELSFAADTIAKWINKKIKIKILELDIYWKILLAETMVYVPFVTFHWNEDGNKNEQ